MELGLRLPQRLGVDLRRDVVEAARTAEAAGYASLWTYERLIFPQTPVEPHAALQDWFTSTRQMLETAVEIRERAATSSPSCTPPTASQTSTARQPALARRQN
jgi:alkanesulfonate monooxygenase SsuD/methylene tetrahydromethanopterin reductase-like flavin-dependent oxidoreductase (luciferase family)